MMISVSSKELSKDRDMVQQSCCHKCLSGAMMTMISAVSRRGLVVWSWSGSASQGSWSWCLSIGISIRRIMCGFSSPRIGSGTGRMPTSWVLVSLSFIAI